METTCMYIVYVIYQTVNELFSLRLVLIFQVELDRFYDSFMLLKDYYTGMEGTYM